MSPTTSARARSTTRAAAAAAAVLLSAGLAGCGGSDPERPDSADSPTPLETSLSPLTTGSPSTAATPPASVPTTAPSSTASGSTQLTASVGTPDDPDAYVITLVDADGEEVTELPAGEYTIAVDDRSTIHNVHLTGDGVEETTTVPEVVTTTWEVTLEPGDYTYRCDPHPNMVGDLTVV